MRLRLPSVPILARRQALCIALAAISAAFFWGIGQQINLGTVLLYSLMIGNLIIPSTQALSSVYWKRPFPYNWLFFLFVILVLLVPIYVISSIVVWWLAPPSPQTLQHLLTTGWKLPVVVTLIFSVFTYIYNINQERLERRNRELQRSVEKGTAQLARQEQELQRAREIQQSLLPRHIPQIPGFEVSGAWRPAQTVSGDYYDAFKLDEHRLAICIADVAGKGVSAALLMANVQAAVRALANNTESPARVCGKVNRLLCENIAVGKFVTFLYGVLDCDARTFAFCNAGHLSPIHTSNGAAKTLDGGGAVLGVFPSWEFEDASVKLEPGDRLLLFTDGITEAMDDAENEFGENSLAALAIACSPRSAVEMNKWLLEEVSKYCSERFQDDATLLVIATK
jgi:phosphoserine phosphatase RsbU/P